MNDLDFIDRKKNTSKYVELTAIESIGKQNILTSSIKEDYLITKGINYIDKVVEENIINKDSLNFNKYIKKSEQSKYLYDLEKYEIEKELNESEKYTKEILFQSQSNYNSRLDYSLLLEKDFLQVDLCSETITYKYNIWNYKNIYYCKPIIINNYLFKNDLFKNNFDFNKNYLEYRKKYLENNKFCLYDIYLKIEKNIGDFTKKDLIKFANFKIEIIIGGNTFFEKDFFSMCFFELIENQNILIEPNIIYLKAITFQNMIYGISTYFLQYHELRINFIGLNYQTHSEFKIDIIYSGKNINIIKPEHYDNNENKFSQRIISSQNINYDTKINNSNLIKFNFKHPVSILMFFLYDNFDESDTDELENTNINAIGIKLNDKTYNSERIWWENEELIKVNFLGINLCVLAIDPALRNYKKFIDYIKNEPDYSMLKSIDFSCIDYSDCVIEYDSNKKYNLYINGLYCNLLNFGYGMGGFYF